jgi:hypothetical protein
MHIDLCFVCVCVFACHCRVCTVYTKLETGLLDFSFDLHLFNPHVELYYARVISICCLDEGSLLGLIGFVGKNK